MNDTEANHDMTASCEGSQELNGKDASYRTANMISAPRTIVKRRVGGVLVPMRQEE